VLFERHPENPIVVPGLYDWRRCITFNAAVAKDADGAFVMLERACGSLHPLRSCIGLLRSDDGVHFKHVVDQPVLTGAMLGFPTGDVQDPRLVRLDGKWLMVFVTGKDSPDCVPTGVGAPHYSHPNLDAKAMGDEAFGKFVAVRSGIAVSDDLIRWRHVGWVGPEGLDDRDNIPFPEKIGGRYAMLRRPAAYVGEKYGTRGPGMWISYSDDLKTWDEPALVAGPLFDWEGMKIGGSAPPLRTEAGWLVSYHGVDPSSRYCVGFMLMDLNDPTKVLGRTRKPVMQPETYYERFGLVIPNVVFPCANVVHEGRLYLYYGCCDTSISLATCRLDDLLELVIK